MTIKTNKTKEQIIEAVLASKLVTDAEAGVKFSDHREFLRIECIEFAPFLCKPSRKWVLYAAHKEIAADESESPFSIETPVKFAGRPMLLRPSCYLAEVLQGFKTNQSQDCYSVITHTYKVPHGVFLDLIQ